MSHLIDRYNPSTLKDSYLDPEEREDLFNILLELRALLRNLQWYAEVNKRGFVKILKKIDKKVHVHTQTRYLNSKVLILPFANASSVNHKLTLANNFIDELSLLADANSLNTNNDETSSISSYSSLGVPELNGLSLKEITATSNIHLTALRQLLPSDDSAKLKELIESFRPSPEVLLAVLYKAISYPSLKCIAVLLDSVPSLRDPSDLNGRNLIHKLVIAHSRRLVSNGGAGSSSMSLPLPKPVSGSATPTSNNSEQQFNGSLYISPAVPPAASGTHSSRAGQDGVNSSDDTNVLVFILDHLRPALSQALVAKDSFKKTPLHYSAQYGLKVLTKVLVQYIKKWELVDPTSPFFGPLWQDSDHTIPIQLSVKGDHPLTSEILLNAMIKSQVQQIPNTLHVATRLGSKPLLKVLLDYGLDVNQIADSSSNETCLYTAAKLNLPEIVSLLLSVNADTEIREKTYGWTPIFAAAIEGFQDVAKILVEHGADISKFDYSGWNAQEHACLRGHIYLLDLLQPNETPSLLFGSNTDLNVTASGAATDNNEPSLTKSPDSIMSKTSTPERSKSPLSNPQSTVDPIKTFGHRYLQEKSMVLVNLGSMDTREKRPAIQLDYVPASKASSTQLDTALSLIISAKNCEGEPVVIDLPLGEGQQAEQYSFYSNNPSNATLFFDLVPTYSGNKSKILGRAVALLSDLVNKVGENKTSLFRTITLPILETTTLEVLGKVRFQFLIIDPFHHPNMGIAKSPTYWKSLITTRVIGHRGLGKNSLSTGSLQLGENTLESFIAAANLGASYVEFDVQLTKDLVPVIYHDFLVGETGIDIPMHSLTLEQFLNISEMQNQRKEVSNFGRTHSPQPRKLAMNPSRSPSIDPVSARERTRSVSLYGTDDDYSLMEQRMKFTRDYKMRGFKANVRGHSIQAPFTTLEEVFKTLPKNVGFNIECKYPTLDESQLEDMDNMAIELNKWVDVVLNTAYTHGQGRDIIFSSFHPEICIMLSLKQPSIPVLFLTEAGTSPMMDLRTTCLQEAIRLARRWDLLGIVSECTPIIRCPRLVSAVKDSGIVCVTYGAMNNNPANARLQMKHGVDAVIVDSVLAVRKGLTEQIKEDRSD